MTKGPTQMVTGGGCADHIAPGEGQCLLPNCCEEPANRGGPTRSAEMRRHLRRWLYRGQLAVEAICAADELTDAAQPDLAPAKSRVCPSAPAIISRLWFRPSTGIWRAASAWGCVQAGWITHHSSWSWSAWVSC